MAKKLDNPTSIAEYGKNFVFALLIFVGLCFFVGGIGGSQEDGGVSLGITIGYILVSFFAVLALIHKIAMDFVSDPELEKIQLKRRASVFWKEYESETMQLVVSRATAKIADEVEHLTLSHDVKETTLALCAVLNTAVVQRAGYGNDDLLLKILDLSLDEFQDLLEEIVNDPKGEELVLLITGSLAPVLAIRSKIIKEQIHLAEQNLITIKNKQLTASDKKAGQFKEPTREQIDASFNSPEFEERLIAFLRKTGQIKD